MVEQHEVKGVLQSPALLGDPSILEAAVEGSGRHTCGFRAQVTIPRGPGASSKGIRRDGEGLSSMWEDFFLAASCCAASSGVHASKTCSSVRQGSAAAPTSPDRGAVNVSLGLTAMQDNRS